MYCGQCGKKVMPNMLFCPFCGSPIVIPEQDEPSAPAAEVAPAVEEAEVNEAEVNEALETEQEENTVEDIPFEPLRFSFDEPEFEAEMPETVPETALSENNSDEIHIEAGEKAEPAVPKMHRITVSDAPKQRADGGRRRDAKTLTPVKPVDMDNLFMDEQSVEAEDEYDLDDDYDTDFDDSFEYEEPEEGGFFQRHIRGIVGLILMLVVVLVVLIWAFSGKGQIALAKMNLAWNAEVYADLGYAAYQQDSALMAAKYYEKALARDPQNYDYAHSAMVAYYEADKIESAASMLKKCVEMRPDSAEPYQEMLILYPDAASRPWEITELINMGYKRTGDESLKLE